MRLHRSASTTSTCQPPQAVPVRRAVAEIDATTAVQMIDLARLGTPRIGVITDAPSADASERRVELAVADKECVMSRTKLFTRIEIEGHAVRCLDRDEMAPFRPRLEIENVGKEFGRYPFVPRRDDRVIEFDTHLVLPSLFPILSRHGPKARRLTVWRSRAYRDNVEVLDGVMDGKNWPTARKPKKTAGCSVHRQQPPTGNIWMDEEDWRGPRF